MHDYLAESRGTLARTAQKKQTAISIYHRQQQLKKKEEKYGFAVRPSNPSLVERPDAIEFYFKEVYGETSNKIAQLQQLDASAIDREGEGPIRRLNKEANDLIFERARWGRRLVEVGGTVPDAQLRPPRRTSYFGVAKFLPEAASQAKQEAEEREAAAEKRRRRNTEREERRGRSGAAEGEGSGGDGASSKDDDEEEAVYNGEPLAVDEPQQSRSHRYQRWLVVPGVADSAKDAEFDFGEEEDKVLRRAEATMLQQRTMRLSSDGSHQRKEVNTAYRGGSGVATPKMSTSSRVAAEEDDGEEGEYDPHQQAHQPSGATGVEGVEVPSLSATSTVDLIDSVTKQLLGQHILTFTWPAEDLVEGGSQTPSPAHTMALQTEKAYQERAFGAKKALMLRQLNRNAKK